MIYQTVDFNSFVKSFKEAGRGDQFSIDGLKMLFDWLEEAYSGDSFELDVIGLCCEFAEYTPEEFLSEFDLDEGIDSVEELKHALDSSAIDCVIDYNLWKDSILVNNNY